MTVAPDRPPLAPEVGAAVARAAAFPRLRYMGSKYRLLPVIADVMADVGGSTVLDAFSGSGVVSYLFKALGYQVTSNDFLNFPAIIAAATVGNDATVLTADDVELVCSPPADDRDFIARTFDGLYFTAADRQFLDAAWSHIDPMPEPKRSLAIAALVLAAAKKQPRGVFTFTDLRYDDGRRDLRLTMAEQFRACAAAYNRVVFDNGRVHRAHVGDVADLAPQSWDVVYLDPPYAPPTDDNCYIKRYHFLEGLSVYWRGQTIMEGTKTKKLVKRYTPFSYKSTVTAALSATFAQFSGSTLVLSYSSNAVPDAGVIAALMREHKSTVDVVTVDHRYSFGTHGAARRRSVSEHLFIGR